MRLTLVHRESAAPEARKAGGSQFGKDLEVKFKCVEFTRSQREVLSRDYIFQTSAGDVHRERWSLQTNKYRKCTLVEVHRGDDEHLTSI